MYYADKIESLRDIFGTPDVSVSEEAIQVGPHRYPVLDDVILLTDPAYYTPRIRARLPSSGAAVPPQTGPFARDIQHSFGEEWNAYGAILPEHAEEFKRYFDVVEMESLASARVCDAGCGSGRWSSFLQNHCRELILVDFSDAIFIARKNLASNQNALFFHGDLLRLPFRDNFADFLFSLGVLHHLPTPCLDEVRRLSRYAPRLLIFLYYALDNRPFYFRWILKGVTVTRNLLCRIQSSALRTGLSKAGTWLVYLPLVGLGKLLKPLGLSRAVPLYDFYHDKSVSRVEQDVYDRFFTRIEQRVTREEIKTLTDTFSTIRISDDLPYWHFLCIR